jgi:hypothetical protein
MKYPTESYKWFTWSLGSSKGFHWSILTTQYTRHWYIESAMSPPPVETSAEETSQKFEFFAKNLIMILNTLAAVVLLGHSASAQNMLRFACSQLTVERADPLVSPGQSPAPHTHQIIGGNSFNLTVNHTDSSEFHC